ncbi:Predicted inosine-uridine preferring nucleoside hydrolase [Ceraceosorus bombacis]|uniref:Predicted inosine-uridine preferring nucleoside hydrolase n=1 Tax=Ceraceosorus bombacis TaxID=401625 RepID=A0A0P1BKA3_9BASI|nr:Predicted inosine-uridine preferring nucleoside hydrolase [Ceraceosorus bombacis]
MSSQQRGPGHNGSGQALQQVSLIIDSDPGVDDVLAFILALALPHVTVKAITLTFGNTELAHAFSNVARTFNVLHAHLSSSSSAPPSLKARFSHSLGEGAPSIELAKGASGPIGGKKFTAGYFHGKDGLSGVSKDERFPAQPVPAPLKATDEPAHKVILKHLRDNPPGAIRIAAIGPVSNLALAFQEDPVTFARVAGISVMGGALDVPGNTSPLSEFNFYADPWAARALIVDAPKHPVLANGDNALGWRRLPIDLLSLDITSKHLVPFGRLCSGQGPLGDFMATILKRPRQVTNSFAPAGRDFDASIDDMFVAHDPIAVAHACFCSSSGSASRNASSKETRSYASQNRPEFDGEWSMRVRRFGIECEGELTRGCCVVDRRASVNSAQGNVDPKDASLGKDEELDEDQKRPDTREGDVHVVQQSPGCAWFSNIFCDALGV